MKAPVVRRPPARRQAAASPARAASFDALAAIEQEQAYASVILALPRFNCLSARDRALLEEITLGVLRWRGQLDYLVEECAKCPSQKLDLEVRIALWMALYQIVHLTRIPTHAIVNDSVELVKAARKRSATGLVNAALRRAAEEWPEMLRRLENRQDLEGLATRFSHPPWLAEKWISQFGREEAIELMRANNARPADTLRLNPFAGGVAGTRDRLLSAGVRLVPSLLARTAFHFDTDSARSVQQLAGEGVVWIQDEASLLVAELAGARSGHSVLDVCAAPGGKSAAMAIEMSGEGRIVAGDLHPHRLSAMKELLARQRIPNVQLVCWNATQDLPLDESARFDRVLVDVPCSGTGTLRRHPEIKWRLALERIHQLATLQLRILSEATNWVHPSGRVVYATCSLEREENEEVVEAFRRAHPHFELISPEPSDQSVVTGSIVRTFPHTHGADGFFVAIFAPAGACDAFASRDGN